jgi:hypothetical protein
VTKKRHPDRVAFLFAGKGLIYEGFALKLPQGIGIP